MKQQLRNRNVRKMVKRGTKKNSTNYLLILKYLVFSHEDLQHMTI